MQRALLPGGVRSTARQLSDSIPQPLSPGAITIGGRSAKETRAIRQGSE